MAVSEITSKCERICDAGLPAVFTWQLKVGKRGILNTEDLDTQVLNLLWQPLWFESRGMIWTLEFYFLKSHVAIG